ncbi:Zinc finger C2H2 [Penicillium verrucosum]|uniref:Zinc finger C2H2 n=1 Tax=Penicillium verrucosum TaxID=60171 RepID=UPI00254586D4|nr:Zinc finger C2H2 [Penicillium verrucosum]KAJ5939978.1 Zinc finger C2H2 [Penicillium verrucosum]
MASPSCNTHCDPLLVPDGYDYTWVDFNYSQFTPPVYQSTTSTLAQPSRVSADPLPYTYPVQHPVASVVPSFAVSSGSPSTCCGICRLNQNAIHQPPIENDRAATALGDPATGYLGPRHDIACANFPASASPVPRAPQVKSTSGSYTKGKRPSGRTQGRQRKQE